MNPAAIVAECNLCHEDLEDWGVQMQQPNWIDFQCFQCEVALGPFSQLAPELLPEDSSVHEGMQYPPAGQETGMMAAICMAHQPNNHPCVREKAAAPEVEERRPKCREPRLNTYQDHGNSFWDVVI